MKHFILLVPLFFFVTFSAWAESESDALEAQLSELREEALDLSESLKEARRTARKKERQIAQWQEEEAALTDALAEEEVRLSSVLSRMAHASRATPISLVATKENSDWVRQAKLMDMTGQALRNESSRLRSQLTEIESLRRAMEDGERELNHALHEVGERYAALQGLLRKRQAMVNQQQSTETRMERIERRRLASKARNVESLLKLLEKESGVVMVREEVVRAGIISADGEAGKSDFRLPAQGVIVKQYGDARAGAPLESVQIRTSPRSLIYAPAAGEIAFSGPFRSYGSLLLIKHEDGYMSLISGFGDPAVVVGQKVQRGEPIGYMKREGESVVSFELRKARKAIDPMPLIAHSVL